MKGGETMRDDVSLTPQEVADILKIAKNTVYELIKRGELRGYKVGRKIRIDPQDVDEYIHRGKTQSSLSSHENQLSQVPFIENNSSQPQADLILCGQDIILDILSRYLEQHPNGIRTLRSHIGSYNSLYQLYHNHVSAATTHLWDGDSDSYNIPYVRRLVPGISCVIIHLACRTQGFYVEKGNPKNIHHWEDIMEKDVELVNREKGSGTRVLLDECLRKMHFDGKQIRGYDHEESSHLAVASVVSRKEADVGIGNEKAALQVQGVEFIPIQKERYDLVFKKEHLQSPYFQAMLEIIRSNVFKSEINGIGGYDTSEMGKIVAET